MKVRKIQSNGYENGVALAKIWELEGLILAPEGEVIEGGYRFINKNYVGMTADYDNEAVHINLLEKWEKRAISRGHFFLANRIRKWSEEEFLKFLELKHIKGLELKIDKAKYPELQGIAEYKDQEAKGIADVLGLDYRKVLLCKDAYRRPMYQIVYEQQDKHYDDDIKGCTTILFKDSSVGRIIGRNMDSVLDSISGLQGYGEPVLYSYPEEMGYSNISVVSVNSKGLTIQGSSIGYPNEPQIEPDFLVDWDNLILKNCKTVDEALELFLRYSIFMPTATNLLFSDAYGNAAVIEKSKYTYAVRRLQDHCLFTTSGVSVEEKTKALLDTESEGYIQELHRHKRIEKYLTMKCENEEMRTVESMWNIVVDHSIPGPVCRHVNNQPPNQLYTLYSFVLVPEQNEYYFRLSKPGPIYPCEHEPVEYRYFFKNSL